MGKVPYGKWSSNLDKVEHHSTGGHNIIDFLMIHILTKLKSKEASSEIHQIILSQKNIGINGLVEENHVQMVFVQSPASERGPSKKF